MHTTENTTAVKGYLRQNMMTHKNVTKITQL